MCSTRTSPVICVVLTLVLTASAARAQDGWTAGVRVPVQPPADVSSVPTQGVRAELIGVEPVDLGIPVIGVPYSAEAVTEFVQTLEDGNRIEQRVVSHVARDSRGRIRREQHGMALGGLIVGGTTITITDGENGMFMTLDLARKLAYRAEVPPSARSANAVVRVQEPLSHPDATTTTRTLAPTQIEGLYVEGTETVLEIAAGSVGNRRPVRVVSERWYSPDLRAVIVTKRHDPRFGRTEFRLTKIQRTEPPPALFEIPAGFRVEEMLGLPAVAIRPTPR